MRILLLVIILFLASCAKDINTKEAVREGVIKHLSSRKNLDLDMSKIDLQITELSFRSNEADAVVSFAPKGSAGAGMTMRYTLERQGRAWVVKNKAESGANPHGAQPPPSAATGPQDAPAVEVPVMPGRPAGDPLPAGHPPISPEGRKK